MRSNDQRTFYIKAVWDDEANVYVSESDILGLHIEADTLEEFERLMQEHAPELALQNHILNQASAPRKSLVDLIPSIFWQRPDAREPICA